MRFRSGFFFQKIETAGAKVFGFRFNLRSSLRRRTAVTGPTMVSEKSSPKAQPQSPKSAPAATAKTPSPKAQESPAAAKAPLTKEQQEVPHLSCTQFSYCECLMCAHVRRPFV